jgi:hypothetical protein
MSDDESKADNAKMETVEPGETKDEADDELQRVCGSDHLSDLARRMWREMEKEKLLDASDQKLSDDDVRKLMNGLHTCGGPRLPCSLHSAPMPAPFSQSRIARPTRTACWARTACHDARH